jgi:deoxyadenosine/deoxycytidine kinase
MSQMDLLDSSPLIAVIGNAGVGKTTLVRALLAHSGARTGLEEHARRPFQALFATDLSRHALPNQVDYLLLRAEQEVALRKAGEPGILDGGLDLDYHGFTLLFYRRGYLSADDFDLCTRLYELLRRLIPPPELYLSLVAPLAVVEERFSARSRDVEIARRQDLPLLGELVESWANTLPAGQVVRVDAAAQNFGSPAMIAALWEDVGRRLAQLTAPGGTFGPARKAQHP